MVLWQESSDTFRLEIIDSRGQVRSSAKSSSRGISSIWTEIELHIDRGQALLSLNGHEHGSLTLPHRARVTGPVYFGITLSALTKIQDSRPQFSGCLRHLKLNGFSQDLWNLSSSKNLMKCSLKCV